MNITLISCWYNMKSKFNVSTYRKWMSHLLNNVNNFNLVIFTNKDSYILLESIINTDNKKIKVILKEFDEFKTWQNIDNWKSNHEMNDLLNNKSRWNIDWKLNMLWSEKINFVNEACNQKYFDTEWYGWCDIGYFRGETSLKTEEIIRWPNITKINNLLKHKIYYGFPGNRKELNILIRMILDKNKNNMPIIPIYPTQVSIAGGFFLIHKDKIEWWHNVYYNRLSEYFKNNYLVKDDQLIIIDCIGNNLTHFQFVEEKNPMKDRWFVFQEYLL
jgi:hypothetical protein